MNIAIILSGGTGSRAKTDVPKQYLKVGGQPVISYSLKTIGENKWIDGIVIVTEKAWQSFIQEEIEKLGLSTKFVGFALPGENRQLSIWSGLSWIKEQKNDCENVFVHDAARPNLSERLINRCFEEMGDADGVLPVIPMKDTLYISETGKKVDKLIDRSKIFAGQAPELFDFEKYYRANMELFPEKILTINGSTEVAFLAGMDITMVEGEETNFKLTTPEDVKRFQELEKDDK